MNTHHKLAVIGAAGASAIALGDAATHGLTGHSSTFADSGNGFAILVGDLVHAALYAALVVVLIREAGRFDATNKAARMSRRVLVVAFGALSVCMALSPLVLAVTDQKGAMLDAWELWATITFLAMILFSMTLGLAVVRSNPLGVGGRVLGLIAPVFLVTIGIAFVAPDWAHPGYLETTINFGLALLGVGAVEVSRPAVPAPPRPRMDRAS